MKEEKAVLAFAAAQQEYLKRLQLLNEVAASLEAATGESLDNPDAYYIISKSLYIDYLNKRMQQCEMAVTKASGRLEEKRKLLIDARKDRMVMDKLKQNQLTVYMDCLHDAEQKALDEMGTVLYTRRMG
jgi:flagellar FliJ protein